MKLYFHNIIFCLLIFLKYHKQHFVQAYLKNISTCVIVENKCLFNQLANINSYCFEENTSRIYKTNIQNNPLKKRKNNENNDNNNIDKSNYSKHDDLFNYYRKKDQMINNKKKNEDNFFMKRIQVIKLNNTIPPLMYPENTNSSSSQLFIYNNENETANENENEYNTSEISDTNVIDDTNEIENTNKYINYGYDSAKVSLVERSLGIEDYSSELCKIDYENFYEKGAYFFDVNNHLVKKPSTSIKSIYICQKENSINCFLPKVDGYYLNTLQKGEIIELSGLKNTNTVLKNIKPEDGYSYINSELLPKSINKYDRDIITCNYDSNAGQVLCEIIDGSEGSYYIQKVNNKNYLIECMEGNCTSKTNSILKGFYINSGSSSMNNTLIYCNDNTCTLKKAENGQHYIGVYNNSNKFIECKNNSCYYKNNVDEGYYINSGILLENNDKPMIYCDSTNTCEARTAYYNKYAKFISGANPGFLITCKNDTFCEESTSPANIGYYINNRQPEITTDPNLIYCFNENNKTKSRVCKEISIKNTDNNGRFISGKPGYLIYYKMVDKDNYIFIHTHPEIGFYLNIGDNHNNTMPLIYCDGAEYSTLASTCETVSSVNGYYLMQSSRINLEERVFTKLIFCENSKCTSVNPTKGYFKYALDDSSVISCNGQQCYLDELEDCQETLMPKHYSAGNCCTYQSQMYLITDTFNITSTVENMKFKNHSIPLQTNSNLKYAYFKVELSEFPGITVNSGSLYKISNYSFTIFPYDNYFFMTKNNEQLLYLNTTVTEYDIDDFRIFNCDSSIESCIPEYECYESKFIYYEPLKLGMRCSNYTLELLNSEGNYLAGKIVKNKIL